MVLNQNRQPWSNYSSMGWSLLPVFANEIQYAGIEGKIF